MDNKLINKQLWSEIVNYCELNEIEIDKTLNEALRQGFTILQYGMGPNEPKVIEKTVEVIKEVPVEKIVEVPVEKIVEVIKEVPVDKIIEKDININVDGKNVDYVEYIDELNKKISKLEINNKKIIKELTDSKEEVNNINQIISTYKVKVENLKKDLKDCKDRSDYDIYGEK